MTAITLFHSKQLCYKYIDYVYLLDVYTYPWMTIAHRKDMYKVRRKESTDVPLLTLYHI